MLEKRPISWLYQRCPEAQGFFNLPLFSNIFQRGGYIAGGLVRKLVRDRDVQGLPEYFDAGGDIDVFFPNEVSFRSVEALHPSRWFRSVGRNAWTSHGFDIWEGSRPDPSMFSRSEWFVRTCGRDNPRGTMQLIDCHFHHPYGMLDSFDLTNSQFAVDGQHIWLEPEAVALEDARVLKARMLTDLLGVRLLKYYTRHGYDTLESATREMLMEWVLWNDQHKWKPPAYGPVSSTAPYGVRHVGMGDRAIVAIASLGLLPDSMLMKYIGRFKVSVRPFCDYSSLRQSGSVNADPIVMAANRARTAGVQPGDMVELMFPIQRGGVTWTSVIVLADMSPGAKLTKHWRVMGPSGEPEVMPQSLFSCIKSSIQTAEG